MKREVKTKLVLTHVVEYYKGNEITKADIIGEVLKLNLNDYWQNVLELAKKSDNGYIELMPFVILTKCVRDYDFCLQRIIERVVIVEGELKYTLN